MAPKKSGKQSSVNPKLRRKMLERWENEGGKVGEIDPIQTSTDSQTKIRTKTTGESPSAQESK